MSSKNTPPHEQGQLAFIGVDKATGMAKAMMDRRALGMIHGALEREIEHYELHAAEHPEDAEKLAKLKDIRVGIDECTNAIIPQ